MSHCLMTLSELGKYGRQFVVFYQVVSFVRYWYLKSLSHLNGYWYHLSHWILHLVNAFSPVDKRQTHVWYDLTE